ncbi:hypothetical protein HDV00_009869 [Rhizophlyctis rosea]|nr:hypothetical protein HDV00_009869 [Rhizophlyctis rosea]
MGVVTNTPDATSGWRGAPPPDVVTSTPTPGLSNGAAAAAAAAIGPWQQSMMDPAVAQTMVDLFQSGMFDMNQFMFNPMLMDQGGWGGVGGGAGAGTPPVCFCRDEWVGGMRGL